MEITIPYQGQLLAGVDEAGRGPLAGPVIAAAVILDKAHPIPSLNDSKKLSAKKRACLYDEIQEHAVAVAVGRADINEIDEINILQASLLAMVRAVKLLSIQPEYVLVDGRDKIDICQPCQAIIQGDSLVPCISAASIIAKVERDREMQKMDALYPDYGFAKHKGYPTKMHLSMIKKSGITPIHRQSFGPVKAILQNVNRKIDV